MKSSLHAMNAVEGRLCANPLSPLPESVGRINSGHAESR